MAGIYIHIPFCIRKCPYCNFYSVASHKTMEAIKDSLITEALLRNDYLNGEDIETIYFGGGTPSLLHADILHALLKDLKKIFNVKPSAEITLEANPDDVSADSASQWLDIGFNRLSIGIQSIDNKTLTWLGRRHDGKTSEKSVEYAINSGFKNISADVIFGVPGLNENTLIRTLQFITNSGINHISAYALTVEQGTALDTFIGKGKTIPPDDEISSEHFNLVMNFLKNEGFLHYEISNYAREGAFSQHNTNYWKGIKYLGLGPSAHSYNIISRQWNVSNINKYISSVKNGFIPAETETLSPAEKCNEYIMTSLRTMWGTDIKFITKTFGEHITSLVLAFIKKHIDSGDIIYNNNILYLSAKGKLMADRISSDLFIDSSDFPAF